MAIGLLTMIPLEFLRSSVLTPWWLPPVSLDYEDGFKPSVSSTPSKASSSSTFSKPKVPFSLSARISDADYVKQRADLSLSAAFVFDATSSMSTYIQQTSNQIREMAKVLEEYISRSVSAMGYDTKKLTVSFSFCAYRDIGDSVPVELIPFGNATALSNAIGGVVADGGDDVAEDICTGLDEMLKAKWPGGHRIIFVIGDSPNHGKRFNCGCEDNHPQDPNGRTWESRFDDIAAKVTELGTGLVICPLKNGSHFDPMYEYLKGKTRGNMVSKVDLNDSKILDSITATMKQAYAAYLSGL
ncbi:hypothetical protein GEMRC1_012779 [Eukaryota sp. GEM-RC1]